MVLYTEMVAANTLAYNEESRHRFLCFNDPVEHPVVLQLGKRVETQQQIIQHVLTSVLAGLLVLPGAVTMMMPCPSLPPSLRRCGRLQAGRGVRHR